MKDLPFMNSTPVYLEICQASLKVLKENAGLELPLERGKIERAGDATAQADPVK